MITDDRDLLNGIKIMTKKVETMQYEVARLHNLDRTEFLVLEHLYRVPERKVQELAEAAGLSSGGVTFVVNKLEKRGILKKIKSIVDKRETNVSLTHSGIQKVNSMYNDYHIRVTNFLNPVNKVEKTLLLKTINKFNDKI